MRIKRSRLIQIISEEVLLERKRRFSNAGSHPDERYETATDKNMFLDRPSSHGGWPEGPSRSAYKNVPVNKQISDYLKSLGILSEDDIVIPEGDDEDL
jgi:hypothetical protein